MQVLCTYTMLSVSVVGWWESSSGVDELRPVVGLGLEGMVLSIRDRRLLTSALAYRSLSKARLVIHLVLHFAIGAKGSLILEPPIHGCLLSAERVHHYLFGSSARSQVHLVLPLRILRTHDIVENVLLRACVRWPPLHSSWLHTLVSVLRLVVRVDVMLGRYLHLLGLERSLLFYLLFGVHVAASHLVHVQWEVQVVDLCFHFNSIITRWLKCTCWVVLWNSHATPISLHWSSIIKLDDLSRSIFIADVPISELHHLRMSWLERIVAYFASSWSTSGCLLPMLSRLVCLMDLVLCVAHTHFVRSKSGHILESFVSLPHALWALVPFIEFLPLHWCLTLLSVLIIGAWPLLMELRNSSAEVIARNVLLSVV